MMREALICAALFLSAVHASYGALLFRFGCHTDQNSIVCSVLSANGRVVAGHNSAGDVVRWTPSEGLTTVGKPPGFPAGINVRGISEDGETISGYAFSADKNPISRSFTWSRDTGFIIGHDEEILAVARGRKDDLRTNRLSLLEGYEKIIIRDEARGGDILVGSFGRALATTYEEVGFMWEAGVGTTMLRDDHGVVFRSAFAVNHDASVIVGGATFPGGHNEAAIWRRNSPIQSIQKILENRGIRPCPFVLYGAIEVSANGNVVLAVGGDDGCRYETCVAYLEETGDVDQDGLRDEWEFAYFGNLRAHASDDPDGDGTSNLQELDNGSNPTVTDAQPYIAEILCGDEVCIRIPSATNWVYTLQFSEDLFQGSWKDVQGQSRIAGSSDVLLLTDHDPAGRGFYRVVAEIKSSE